ncbi:MAG TPA: ATP-binding protein [Pseudolabrys sp.]|nr:ATP-binding protein [Pseudolabrys sp.]
MPDEYSLSESTELLLFAEEIGRIGIIDWDVAAGTVRLSPYALTMYGLEDFDGRYENWIATVYREDQLRLRAVIATALEAKEREFELDFRIIRPNDKEMRWILARRLAFYDKAGKPVRVVGVSVDVTDRKRELVELRNFTEALEAAVKERTHELEDRTNELEAEYEARKRAEELLRQAQKMEAVGQLTGGVAHDFNNLLTIIQGGLEMIGRQVAGMATSPASSRIVRGMDMALEAVRRAARLTERLLAFARQQPLEPKAVDANRLVGGICEMLRRMVGETIAFETVLSGGLWLTLADLNQLENSVLNLVVNARDAMPNGGKVTIETANAHLDDAYVRKLSEPVNSGQYVLISVSDTGAGMDAKTLERAFEPFFTTKGVGKGTGLGLSQVYGFVRQSSGHVAIYSEVGEGTTVKIYLPRHHGKEDVVEDSDGPSPGAQSLGAETILVVEDDEALRLYTVEILSDLGYSVLAARDGATALEILARGHEVDLLFTDIVMPGGMNGRQLAEEAVRQRPTLKVLFTTGYTANAIVHHGRLDPDVELVSKPFTYETLGSKIRMMLDSRRD